MAPRADSRTDSRLAARLAALASFGAAVIHFAVVPAHWQEWVPAGLFFASIAVFQLLWARAMFVRPTTAVIAVGIAGTVGAIALWALSRTVGAPLGPHAGEPELVQAADLCALLLQIYVVMGASWVWHRGRRAQPVPALVNAMILVCFTSVIASAATLGAASGLRHGHHAPPGAASDHHTSAEGHEGGHHEHPAPPPMAPPEESVHPLDAPAPGVNSPPAAESPHESDGDHHHDE